MFDSEVWREASKIELALGGCFSTIKDSVGKVDTSYYICNSKEWIYATEVQYDTYKQECSEFGQIIHGNVNPKYAYFCYGNEWKRFYGNESITYGKLVDARDGHVYRTVKVGGYIWMAENLNYADEKESPNLVDNNWCYEGDSVSCSMGRYYTWAAALDISSDYNYSVAPAETVKNSHRGICAKGWHIPNRDEWDALFSAHEGDWYAMQAKNFASWQHATDIYGFSVIPNGYADDGYCEEYGSCAFFWSATERSSVLAYSWAVYSWDSWLHYNYTKIHKASVRCVKDEE